MAQTIRLTGKAPRVPKTTEQEIDILTQKIIYLEGILAELHDQVDKNNSGLIEKIGICREGLKDLQSLLYGDPRFLITGLASEIKAVRVALESLEDEREAFLNQIKGMKIALILLGLTGGGTLVTLLTQIFTGVGQ